MWNGILQRNLARCVDFGYHRNGCGDSLFPVNSIILLFITWLNYVKIKKFLIMDNLFLKRIIAMLLLAGCRLKSFKA